MNVSIIALNYIWYHYKAKYWVSTDDEGVEKFFYTTDQIKENFRKEYKVESIYDFTQQQVDEDFEKRRHIGGKYIFFRADYLEKDWGKDETV